MGSEKIQKGSKWVLRSLKGVLKVFIVVQRGLEEVKKGVKNPKKWSRGV